LPDIAFIYKSGAFLPWHCRETGLRSCHLCGVRHRMGWSYGDPIVSVRVPSLLFPNVVYLAA